MYLGNILVSDWQCRSSGSFKPPSYGAGLGPVLELYTWYVWWTKWYWCRFLFDSTSQSSYHQWATPAYHPTI